MCKCRANRKALHKYHCPSQQQPRVASTEQASVKHACGQMGGLMRGEWSYLNHLKNSMEICINRGFLIEFLNGKGCGALLRRSEEYS